MKYEFAVGLEVHIELLTKTKTFCGCATEFGGTPNSHCCPICMGFPGALPVLNSRVVDYAIMAGLATNCKINHLSNMVRKNYVYPDLPKAYQISQNDRPICSGGHIKLSSGKNIRINRIQIEEDAGKLIHSDDLTLIDYNRCGVPLLEIVTEPDMRSIEEVKEFIERLQLIIKYIGISDCKMQEGSMRCDVNISTMLEGESSLGTRTEIKNMNSIAFILKAIRYEFERQKELLIDGQNIKRETLRYVEKENITKTMRRKEAESDYRFFREPDLNSIIVTEEKINDIQTSMPELPDVKLKRFVELYSLDNNSAQSLVKYKKVAEFFEDSIENVASPRIACNLILCVIFKILGAEKEKEDFDISVSNSDFNKLVLLVDKGKISINRAKSILEQMIRYGKTVSDIVSVEDISSLSEEDTVNYCRDAINIMPKAAEDYVNGKTKALKPLIGAVMSKTNGKADAKLVQSILVNMLNK